MFKEVVDLGRHISREDMQMANKSVEPYSALIIMEVPTKITVRNGLGPVRVTVTKHR